MRLIKATKHSLVTLFAVRPDNKSELKVIVLNTFCQHHVVVSQSLLCQVIDDEPAEPKDTNILHRIMVIKLHLI